MTTTGANSSPRWLSILITLGIAILSVVISVVLTFAIISYAYAFAGHQIGSYDQLSLLGSGPRFALASAWLPGLISSVAGLAVLLSPGHPNAWTFPAVGVALGIVLSFVCCLTFQQPPPMTGG